MRPRATVLACCLGLVLAACGSSDEADPAAAASPTSSTTGTATIQPGVDDDGLPDEPPGTFTPAAPDPTVAATPAPTTPPAPPPEPEPTSAPPPPAPEPEPEPEPPPPPDAPARAAVTIADFDYAPDPVEVAAGGTVTWTNQDSTAHTATVSGGPNTGSISGGSSASLTFDTPGTYDYVCQFHPGSMTGTVVVR